MTPTICEVKKTRPRKQSKMPEVVKMRAVARAEEISRSIDYLVDEAGISLANISRELGCSRWQVWAWRKGIYSPREPLIAFSIIEWAAFYRDSGPYYRVMRQLAENNKRSEQ